MKHILIFSLLVSNAIKLSAQELFLFTYPASNIPKNAMMIRGMNSFFQQQQKSTISYHFMPEIEYGVSKKFMFLVNGFISNENNKINLEGISLLSQYRFFNKDGSKKHFRIAFWNRLSINNAEIHQEEIELNGHNSGYRLGLTATQLLRKTAISSTISYQKAFNNFNQLFPNYYSNQAIDYTVSLGHLLFPKEYKNFSQTNVNLMVEILGQLHSNTGKNFIDIAPVVQFIFKSKSRLDLAYRRQLYSNIYRTQPNGIIVNFQYNIFNVLKRN